MIKVTCLLQVIDQIKVINVFLMLYIIKVLVLQVS